MRASKTSVDRSATWVPEASTPALFTKMCTAPNAATASSNSRSTWPSSVTSACTNDGAATGRLDLSMRVIGALLVVQVFGCCLLDGPGRLIKPASENVCGKLLSSCPDAVSTCSDSSPTSLARAPTRSNTCRARSTSPARARHSARAFNEAGDQVEVICDGAGTTWPDVLADPQHTKSSAARAGLRCGVRCMRLLC